APDTRVDPAEPWVQHVPQVVEREIRDVQLAYLGNENEPLTRDLEGIRQLHVAREDQHQLVARAELVVGRDGSREQREKLGRGALKHVHAEYTALAPGDRSHQSRVNGKDLTGRGHALQSQ